MPASELHELLSRKLAQCGVMFDFLDCVADLKGKEVKRAALNELVECVGSTRGVLIEPVYPDIIRMVSTVVCMGTLLPARGAPGQRINPYTGLALGPMSSRLTRLPAPLLPLGVWKESQEERGGKEGDSRRCVGWRGASSWGALRRQMQEQLGLVRAGAKREEAC